MADETVTTSTGAAHDSLTGSLSWEVDNISELEMDKSRSGKFESRGITLRCAVYRHKSMLYAFLAMPKNDSVMWSLDVSAQFTLCNDDVNKNAVSEINGKLNHSKWVCGTPFVSWSDLMDEDKGFLTDDGKITIKARFTLSNIMGIRRYPLFDFTNPNDPRNDVVLNIDGEKIYVNKAHLSFYSPVFNTMFFGDFSEKDKNEIVINDVDSEDFIEMLNMIYPTGTKVTGRNCGYLLELGDRFQIKTIIDQVEQYLIGSSKFSVAEKLKISGDFQLAELQGSCLNSFTTVSQITNLYNKKEYEKFTDATKMSLLEKIMKLSHGK